jgi:hypothetical protein
MSVCERYAAPRPTQRPSQPCLGTASLSFTIKAGISRALAGETAPSRSTIKRPVIYRNPDQSSCGAPNFRIQVAGHPREAHDDCIMHA